MLESVLESLSKSESESESTSIGKACSTWRLISFAVCLNSYQPVNASARSWSSVFRAVLRPILPGFEVFVARALIKAGS